MRNYALICARKGKPAESGKLPRLRPPLGMRVERGIKMVEDIRKLVMTNQAPLIRFYHQDSNRFLCLEIDDAGKVRSLL